MLRWGFIQRRKRRKGGEIQGIHIQIGVLKLMRLSLSLATSIGWTYSVGWRRYVG
jgi:hypothetical protein